MTRWRRLRPRRGSIAIVIALMVTLAALNVTIFVRLGWPGVLVAMSAGLCSFALGVAVGEFLRETPALTIRASNASRTYLASHEAGHALLLAALTPMPNDIEVALDAVARRNMSFDFHGHETAMMEWILLFGVAGRFGESSLTGTSTAIAADDVDNWTRNAKVFLSLGLGRQGTIFYPDPVSGVEQQQNTNALLALKESQQELLMALFAMNHDVLEALAKALMERGRLTRTELVHMLKPVIFPRNFPRPTVAEDAE